MQAALVFLYIKTSKQFLVSEILFWNRFFSSPAVVALLPAPTDDFALVHELLLIAQLPTDASWPNISQFEFLRFGPLALFDRARAQIIRQ